MDCDQLMIGDIAELWRLRDEKYAFKFVNTIMYQELIQSF